MIIPSAVKSFFASLFLLLIFQISSAQIGIGVAPPDSSAMLHVQDTARGMLIPRMTEAQKNAIHHPAEGLMIYQTDIDKGFWYYNGTQWLSFDKSYKSILYLTGDITDSEAIAKIEAEVGPSTQEIQIYDCSALTTVDFPLLTGITKITISNNPVLQSVNFSRLKKIDASITVSQCPALNNFNLPVLETIGTTLSVTNTGLLNLTLPALKKVNTKIEILNHQSLLTVSFPVLTGPTNYALPVFSIRINKQLKSVSVPSLTRADSISFFLNKQCNTVSFPSLNTVQTLSFKNDSALASVSFPSLTTVNRLLEVIDDSAKTLIGSQAFSFPVLATAGGISISRVKSTAVNFPALTTIGSGGVSINITNSISTISMPLLAMVTGSMDITYDSVLTSLSLPALTTIGTDFTLSYDSVLSSLSLPALTSVGGNFSMSYNPLLSTLYLPSLGTIGKNFLLENHLSLPNFSVPVLTSVGGIWMTGNSLFSTITFPSLSVIAGSNSATLYSFISLCPNLTTVLMPNLTQLKISFIISRSHLPSSHINEWLNKFVSISVTNKTINLSYQSPYAPPTGQGITDKATLQSRGNTVYTD